MPTPSSQYTQAPWPQQWIAHVSRLWVSPAQLYTAVKDLALVGGRGRVIGAEKLDQLLARGCIDPDLEGPLSDVKVLLGKDEYTMSFAFDPFHTFGQGGHTVRTSSLSKNGIPLLKSISVVHYTSYSDDSEDHEGPREENTFLLAHDELADAALASLRQ